MDQINGDGDEEDEDSDDEIHITVGGMLECCVRPVWSTQWICSNPDPRSVVCAVPQQCPLVAEAS